MRLKLDELSPQLRRRIQEQIAADARIGKLCSEVTEPKVERPLEPQSSGCKARQLRVAIRGPRVRIAFTVYRRRLLDKDNLCGGLKPLRDAIARWIGLDDADHIIEWEYGQQQTNGQQGTAVRLEIL